MQSFRIAKVPEQGSRCDPSVFRNLGGCGLQITLENQVSSSIQYALTRAFGAFMAAVALFSLAAFAIGFACEYLATLHQPTGIVVKVISPVQYSAIVPDD